MRIELVSSEILTRVTTDREKYRGRKFLTDNGDVYTACDNSDGDAWTEDFDCIVDAVAWLEGREKDDTENESASVLKNGLLIIQTGLRLHSTPYDTLRHDILEQMKSGLVVLPSGYEAVYIPHDTKVQVEK